MCTVFQAMRMLAIHDVRVDPDGEAFAPRFDRAP
jgi:hypothetical protein